MQRLLIDALAAHRLTRLVTTDVLTQRMRDGVIMYALNHHTTLDVEAEFQEAGLITDREGDPQDLVQRMSHPPKLAELVTCRWCAGMWVALGIVLVGRRLPGWRWLSEALALSSAAALLAAVED